MRISEFSSLTGLSASALRYYEREGLLPKPARRSGKRCYDASQAGLARLLHAAREAGLSIAELRALAAEKDGAVRKRLVRAHARAVGAKLAALRRQRTWMRAAAACECLALRDCQMGRE